MSKMCRLSFWGAAVVAWLPAFTPKAAAMGAVTFEALVRIDFNPAAALGNSGSGRNLPMQLLTGDQDSSGGGVRSWQLWLDPAGFNSNAADSTAT